MWEKLKAMLSDKCDVDAAVKMLDTMTADLFLKYVRVGLMSYPVSEAAEVADKFAVLAKTIAASTDGMEKVQWVNAAWMLDPTNGGSRVTRIR